MHILVFLVIIFCSLQITERHKQEEMVRLNLKHEQEKEKAADAAYQEFVQQETERMHQRGFTPRASVLL